jgi:hypothetical protein
MRSRSFIPLVAVSLVAASTASSREATDTTIDAMPVKLESQWALSAAPAGLREKATVHLLDPKKGYRLSRQGSNGVTCIVQRTAWELTDFRNDIYIPLCYDAAGTTTYLKVIMDAAALRVQGLSPAALKAEIEKRFSDRTYRVPEKAGVSYMVAPLMRTVGPPDMQVHTMAMPHLMFYAPYITNEDIGALPDLSDPKSLLNPFIDKQGIAEQSYMIQMIGEAEKAQIFRNNKALLDELCSYRDILCLTDHKH